MNSGIRRRIDPSIVVSITAAALLLTALTSSQAIGRLAQVLVQTGWLYLSNTRG